MTTPIELRQLRFFISVLADADPRIAARRFGVTPTVLTHAMSSLEQHIGVALAYRTPRGFSPTEAGSALARQGAEFLNDFDDSIREVQSIGRGATGILRLGFTAAGRAATSQLIRAFRSRHPTVDVHLHKLKTSEQTAALHQRRIDVSVVRSPVTDPALGLALLTREPRVVAIRRDHDLAAQTSVRVAELADLPVLRLRDVPEDYRRWWAVEPRPDGSTVHYGPEIASLDEAIEHVLQGDGVHITIGSVAPWSGSDEIAFVPIVDVTPAEIHLAWRRIDRSPAVSALVAVAAELFPSSGDVGPR